MVSRFDVFVERLFDKNFRSSFALTTRIACVTEVSFVSHLFASKNYFFSIDDDYVVTTFYVWRE